MNVHNPHGHLLQKFFRAAQMPLCSRLIDVNTSKCVTEMGLSIKKKRKRKKMEALHCIVTSTATFFGIIGSSVFRDRLVSAKEMSGGTGEPYNLDNLMSIWISCLIGGQWEWNGDYGSRLSVLGLGNCSDWLRTLTTETQQHCVFLEERWGEKESHVFHICCV